MAGNNRIEFDGKQQRTAVIAFGGNALLRPHDHGTQEEQFTLSWKATRWLVEIIHRGYELAIVHGNGPQVGNIMIQVEEAITKIPPQSLDVAVAQTQGSMGYMLANQLRNRFNEEQLEKEIAAVLTEVEVDRDDPAFDNPSKPVGPYFTAYRANLLMQEHGWQMVEDAGRGWRKVVASPMPKRILGCHLLKRLVESGAVLVAVSDSRGAIHNPAGLEVARLLALKEEGRPVTDYAEGTVLERDAVIGVECDIWIPAARPDVINEENVSQLNTRLVVEGANIPLTLGAERYLHDKGILCVPDFIANAGGVICAAMEYHGAGESMALQNIEEKVRRNTEQVLKMTYKEKITPREAAQRLAQERVKKAMTYRRFSSFSMGPNWI